VRNLVPNISADLYRREHIIQGQDLSTGENRAVQSDIQLQLEMTSNQPMAARETGLMVGATYTGYYTPTDPSALPRPNDVMHLGAAYFGNSWTNALQGKWLDILSVTPGDYRVTVSLKESGR
jgi:hypothetical protein